MVQNVSKRLRQMCCELNKYMRTTDYGGCRKPYRNLSVNRMTKASVFRTMSLSLCYCVPAVNLIYCGSLGFCSQVSPAATLAIMEQSPSCQEPMASTALLAVSVCNWDSHTLPRSGIAIWGLSTHQVLVTSWCLHGLLYAAVQLFRHCFTC